jgi:hypothetical protein
MVVLLGAGGVRGPMREFQHARVGAGRGRLGRRGSGECVHGGRAGQGFAASGAVGVGGYPSWARVFRREGRVKGVEVGDEER